MLLYSHPINDAREARGALPVNSFWLSGCGRSQPRRGDGDGAAGRRHACVRRCWREDWAAWAEAWRALDAQVLAPLAAHAQRAAKPSSLTLCGERLAQRFDAWPRGSLWSRLGRAWRRADRAAVLEAL